MGAQCLTCAMHFFHSKLIQLNLLFWFGSLTIIIIETNLFADYPQFIDYRDNFPICFIEFFII